MSEAQIHKRPRAATGLFPAIIRSITKHDVVPTQQQMPLSLHDLVRSLTHAVPSLQHAKALASALALASPLPSKADLIPIYANLCAPTSPPALQAAGFDIFSAYWDHAEALPMDTAERLSYFSLFIGSASQWDIDLWEPRLKALRALTRDAKEIIGIEAKLVNTLQRWIEGAFDGLLSGERNERTERERSLGLLVKFLEDVLVRTESISRITDREMANILSFYGSLVDRSIALPERPRDLPTPPVSTTSSSRQTHRRNLSSLSSASLPSASSPVLMTFPRPPSEIATNFYLDHVSANARILSPSHLQDILPLLFRALASCAQPLARLSVIEQQSGKNTLEEKITEMLNALFTGPHAARCMLILKQRLYPPEQELPPQIAIMTSLGAHRMLRSYIRRALYARLARAYISRAAALGTSPSGAPGQMALPEDLVAQAWPKDDFTTSALGGNGWDAGRMGEALANSVEAWIKHQFRDATEERGVTWDREREGRDEILEEAAGVLKDILQELDLREDDPGVLDEEEARIVGLTLFNLSAYILPLSNHDGTPFIIPIERPQDAPTAILRTISSLLARDHSTALNPLLSSILMNVADHLTDLDTSVLPSLMMKQHDLSPTSPQWLTNWESVLSNKTLLSPFRPLTRKAVMEELQTIYTGVRDMEAYRRPLGDLLWRYSDGLVGCPGDQSDDADVIWKMLGEEIVLRSCEENEDDEDAQAQITAFLDLMFSATSTVAEDEDVESFDTASVNTAGTHSPAIPSLAPSSTVVSPTLSRTHTDLSTLSPHKESIRPSVIAMFSSLAAGGGSGSGSRSQSLPTHQEGVKEGVSLPPRDDSTLVPREASACAALVEIFSQLVFTPLSLEPKNLRLALRVYDILLAIVSTGKSALARVTALQFLMRLRADRDHRLYFVGEGYDSNGLTHSLAELINRVPGCASNNVKTVSSRPSGEATPDDPDIRKARTRPHDRDDRQTTARGRGPAAPSHSKSSRSRSRTMAPPPLTTKPLETLWHLPERLPFFVAGSDTPSEVLVSYDPYGPDQMLVLPVSRYLNAIDGILEKETNWEVLSYLLCHLPVQLSNKHLFCGPKSRQAISKMITILLTGILNEQLAVSITPWPIGLKARDAHGLAYQTLSVLVSYKRCFDLSQCHMLVETFQKGLNGQFSTIKCCLHSLSLAAFELPSSMTKCLTRILHKLSQIMSNPNMAVHILGFLAIIGSLPSLHVNFTESDFKMVFGVALQYLQHYNQEQANPTMSWALSQHVRILSYSVVYTWFLAVKLPDRPKHIRYIARQLLLANEGNHEVDEATEVCFDWLARYTYASADPRPASSTFSDIVLNPPNAPPDNQKSWVQGNSVITIRSLARSGWVEVTSRRPSGFSRFVCHIENVPMVGPGDVSPDLLSIPAALLMERDPSKVLANGWSEDAESESQVQTPTHELTHILPHEGEEPPTPDPITGYVWSGTAPSQRRKEVSIDPSFLILQLSPFPDGTTRPYTRRVPESSMAQLNRFMNAIDRIPVIDTHKVGIMYVAPGQTEETDILRNVHGSPAYTRFLEGIGRLINLRDQIDVYAGVLIQMKDGEYAYAWWDDIGQILYHTATMMPTTADDERCNNKKRHIGNDYVRIVWNDSGKAYRFDTLSTQFQFVNIVIEPHSVGSIAAFSNNLHEHEYFKVTVQLAPTMPEFAPIGHFKVISAENLPFLIRQLSLLSDWFASIFADTDHDTVRKEKTTNWRHRLGTIRRFKSQLPGEEAMPDLAGGHNGSGGAEGFHNFI